MQISSDYQCYIVSCGVWVNRNHVNGRLYGITFLLPGRCEASFAMKTKTMTITMPLRCGESAGRG